MNTRVLIRADNLRSGGGLQVAQSFLIEMAALLDDDDVAATYPWMREGLRVRASTEVLKSCGSALGNLPLEVSDDRLRSMLRANRGDVVFTLFGPTYNRVAAGRTICGFADGTSLFWDVPGAVGPGLGARLKAALRRRISRRFYQSIDTIIVEANHVRSGLANRWGVDPNRIRVVPNVLNQVFQDTPPTRAAKNSDVLEYCYITRAYPHKNLKILGDVATILQRDYALRIRFLLTLTASEWSRLSTGVKQVSVNLGPANIEDLPAIYGRSDGCVFPSKLESFSITPLEALATATPLIASDRPFCRDVLGATALYADPDAAQSWADAIARATIDVAATAERVRQGLLLTASWPDARERALAYLQVVDAELRVQGQQSGGTP